MKPLRIVFMGSAELACASLEALLSQPGFQVVAAVSQPDRPVGRNLQMHAPPVKQLALQHGLPVLQPERARHPSFVTDLKACDPQLVVVAAYGQILPPTVLDLPEFGCLNVHASLLPRYRGAAPIQYALLNGDTVTGITIMKMDEGMDTGGMLSRVEVPIEPNDTSETLQPRLARCGAALLVQSIPLYVRGEMVPQPQPSEGVSYAPKIKKEQGHIDWSRPASLIERQLRAFTPWPGLFTALSGNPPLALKIWGAAIEPSSGPPGEVLAADKDGIVVGCGLGSLRILTLQREGRRRMGAAEFLAGTRIVPGSTLS